jgi:hypothetical protein
MKRILRVVRRFRDVKPVNIHDLDEHGLRAPWLPDPVWRLFLVSRTPTRDFPRACWQAKPLSIRLDPATAELAMELFFAGENVLRAPWPLPGSSEDPRNPQMSSPQTDRTAN